MMEMDPRKTASQAAELALQQSVDGDYETAIYNLVVAVRALLALVPPEANALLQPMTPADHYAFTRLRPVLEPEPVPPRQEPDPR